MEMYNSDGTIWVVDLSNEIPVQYMRFVGKKRI